MNNTRTLFLFAILSLCSCNRYYLNSIYSIPSKQLYKKQQCYTRRYGYINSLTDTTVDKRGLRRIYKEGILQSIGRTKNEVPIGYWFIFKDSMDLEYILKYDLNKIDSFYHPFAIVNQKW